jgi:putative aldouronate transport system permease protein
MVAAKAAYRSRAKVTAHRNFLKNWDLYLLLFPAVVYYLIFCYTPMAGLVIAFKDYNVFTGIFESPWSGLDNFVKMVNIPGFWNIVRNTLLLNILTLVFSFPIPVILALMLNELRQVRYKKVVQSVLYLPHFMSWIVLIGIMSNLLSPQYGIVNAVIRQLGGRQIFFLGEKGWWVFTYVVAEVWKTAGWNSIIFLAALSGIDTSLYEAAVMDGANKWRQITNITIPCLMPTITIMLILNLGRIVSIGFEHPMAQYNSLVSDVAQVISTYTYSAGIEGGNFTVTTALGLVQSVVNLAMVLSANKIAKFLGGDGFF